MPLPRHLGRGTAQLALGFLEQRGTEEQAWYHSTRYRNGLGEEPSGMARR